MKLKSKHIPITTAGAPYALVHIEDAVVLDLYPDDRIHLKYGKKHFHAIVDVTHTDDLIKSGQIGLFKSLAKHIKKGTNVDVEFMNKPDSVRYIKKKLDGKELNKHEIDTIIQDIVYHKLSNIELSFFVAAGYVRPFTDMETYHLTKAMVETGDILKPKAEKVFDKHCIGGVPGNRTTPIVVSICAAAGLTMPKTSSRSITSPAGTADTMEVICKVDLKLKEIKKIVDKHGACFVWGGALQLAPADDDIIQVEHPLSIDAEGQLIASILAKKFSVSSNNILIDIPVAQDAKVMMKAAKRLAKRFVKIGKKFGAKVKVMISDGDEPVGNGVGPSLEAKDVLYVLQNHIKGPNDLRDKSLMMAGILLEMSGKAKRGKGKEIAKEILISGRAFEKFKAIAKAQGAKCLDPEKIRLGHKSYTYKSNKSGTIRDVDNHLIAAIAKGAGAPIDKEAGMYMYKHIGNKVKKDEPLFTIYSDNEKKLEYAKTLLKEKIFRID